MARRWLVGSIAVACAVALAGAPAGAQFTENALGSISHSGSNVTISTGAVPGARWFGLRVFTVPAGTMASFDLLKTSNAAYKYPGAPGSVACVSDFQGRGTSGGMLGPASAGAALADPAISMIGGFVGTSTGCTDGDGNLTIVMNTTGGIIQSFYGAFWGTTAAEWRGGVGSATGYPEWWNLWGNFTALGYGASG